jgi:DNA polymerase III epsilon subunit-like protein
MAPLPSDVWAVDVETTGLDSRARIVEVAAVHSREGSIVEQWSAVIGEPDEHGRLDVRAALRALGERVRDVPVVMHNAGFDLRMISVEAQRVAVANPIRRSLCTLGVARRVLVGLPSYDLGAVARAVGLTCVIEHRALPDALVTARVYERLRSM